MCAYQHVTVQEADPKCGPLVPSGQLLSFTESGKYSTSERPKEVTVRQADGTALNFIESLTF
jgi:hypothetical protein